MLEQTFSFGDIIAVAFVVIIECLLSCDNAVILSSIANRTAQKDRKKALWIGSISAVILRIILIAFAFVLISNPWLQLVGAIYLFFLAIRSILYHDRSKQKTGRGKTISLGKAVITIELTDLLFALDSVIAAVAITGANMSKLWIIYLGGIIGLLAMRFVATQILKLFKTFPALGLAANCLILLYGLKLVLLAFEGMLSFSIPFFNLIFWILNIAFILYGFLSRKAKKR